ncbi:MAG: thioredoxin family protein [Gemmataceae bacterium]|nr:thioredoxin family protein [Gemmataceae bacterium]
MSRPLPLAVLLALAVSAAPAAAAERFSDLASATLTLSPSRAKPGETVTVTLTIAPKNGGWTYPFVQPNGSASANKLRLPDTKQDPNLVLRYPAAVADPKAKQKPDGSGELYYPDPVTWTFPVTVADDARPGKVKVHLGKSRIQVCDAQKCLAADTDEMPSAELEIVDDGRGPAPKSLPAGPGINKVEPKDVNPNPTKVDPRAGPGADPRQADKPEAKAAVVDLSRKVPKPLDDYERDLKDVEARLDHTTATKYSGGEAAGLGPFLLSAALFGLISLVTPCVFPMIPITVSIFLKQAHGSVGARLKLAGVYSLTIITVLGLSAFALLRFMSWLSTQPVTNVLLGVLFVVLALSLFGMYDLTLPNFMVRRLQKKQAQGGVVGTIFGALAFTVISFTCVAPFLGGFAGISQADTGGSLIAVPTTREILGGLAFATAFAAPFFLLALVPGLLKALPRSGGWLDSVKVVMGFLELAAALKFFRTAELRVFSPTQYFTYDLVLAGWVAISAACWLYLLNVYRLPHDEERPNIGVPRLLFAVAFLGFAMYLLPGLYRGPEGKSQRPGGATYAWIEAFLLPEASLPEASTDLKDRIDRTLAEAKEKKTAPRPVFVDFTGVTCTNCKYNESNVFTRPEVRRLLSEFDMVQLYTDEVPADHFARPLDLDAREDEATANKGFQKRAFKTITLPLYAVLLPKADGTVEVLAVYDLGKINDVNGFVKFLTDSLDRAKTGR